MSVSENVVVVAVRAEREISKTALAWALTHVVRPGDLVTLLAVLSHHHNAKAGWRRKLFWAFPRLGGGDCRTLHREGCQIPAASCSQIALQIDGCNEVNVRIKVVGSESVGAGRGVVAAEAKRVGANWIVLDKNLKQEESHCMEELQCSIVVVKGSCAKVLRLNLGGAHRPCPSPFSFSTACSPANSDKLPDDKTKQLNSISSSGDATASSHGESRANASRYSTTIGASPVFVCEQNNPLFERLHHENLRSVANVSLGDVVTSGSDSSWGASPLISPLGSKLHQNGAHRDSSTFHREPGPYSASASSSASKALGVYWIPQNHSSEESLLLQSCKANSSSSRPPPAAKTLQQKFSETGSQGYSIESLGLPPNPAEDNTYSSDVREAVALLRSSPSIPPPLCSLCRHKGPVFGKPPRQFTYQELEEATDGFSGENFMGEGCFGCVHRGILEDGQVVAVKRIKAVRGGNVIGEDEFCAETEVLSRAQHRNVVMLIGFCVEERWRVLVYEYICNGSLDLHLHGRGKPPLYWQARTKIAVGVARGLRYLHEDCRVGFVVHRDMRPNNILLTHDFEPLVGDFSLTRWQTEKSPPVDNHVAETFGYLAPEYIEHGVLTEKADLYAFGVVLLELITGRKAVDITQPKGQQFLVEWARPLLSLASVEGRTISFDRPFLDPRLDRDQARFFSRHLHAMARAASLCLRRDPQARPSMSKVLRVLEGDTVSDSSFDAASVGSRSGRMNPPGPFLYRGGCGEGGSISHRYPHEVVAHATHAERSWW